ncbi:MAG TPA: Pycsar system effector family protein [Flavisolibacter sp.]|nr:Pycsar system effector family protein [Flavisolibacter sp.]
MNEAQEQILSAARHYVTELFTHQVKPAFVFHNLDHTESVAESASQMADFYRLNDEDRFVLMNAAWFHDTGYSSGRPDGHEDVSVQIASRFLHQHSVDEAIIHRISSAIQSTRMPQSPVSQVEKILCDADLTHLATGDFKAMSQLLKQERENLLGQKISKKEWRKGNIRFLEEHHYFTEFGQDNLEPKKNENLASLKKKSADRDEDSEVKPEVFPYISNAPAKQDEKALQKSTERGIQTMFRIVSGNHLRLSSMSDNKSHIMISVNSIIISIVISVLFGKLAYYREYIVPACVLLAVCLGSMTFAILATRPSVSGGRFTEEDIRNKKTNLLFFGNFFRMQVDDYQWAMNQMMKDGEYLYNSMIKDVYFLGVVLAKKYRYLRISYTIFMVGLIVAVAAFAIAAIITQGSGAANSVPTIDY